MKEMEKVNFECMECGKRFSRPITDNTWEMQCPKCKGFDTEPE